MASINSQAISLNTSQNIIAAADKINENDAPWSKIETDARELANGLRSKDSSDLHTALGKGDLPTSIVALLNNAFKSGIPEESTTLAAFELYRLAANLCMDHDANRQLFLDAKFHETTLSILNDYLDLPNPTTSDLKVAKTAVGALLNSCFSFAPACSRLISLKASNTVLLLARALYPPARWAVTSSVEDSLETLISSYQIRIGLADWCWRLISAIGEGAETTPLGPESLEPLIFSLCGFIPSAKPSSPLVQHAESRKALIVADIESLEECVTLLEGLSLDSEEIRLRFVESLSHPAEQSLILQLVEFVEKAKYPEYWKLDGEDDRKQREKAFDMCKAGSIKALISIAGETKAMDNLWGDGTLLVNRMAHWTTASAAGGSKRDDLVIAGCLTLGNLARKDVYCEALLREPYNLLPSLIEHLKPEADIKVKHSVAGLLKNLAQAPANRRLLGQSGVLEQLTHSQVWGQSCDMAETVQVSAIGVAKHLCNGDVANSLRLMSGEPVSGTDQIVALVKRSDSVIVKSEGTRVLAYCVKSVWRKDPSAEVPASSDLDARRKQAMNALSKEPIVDALANLLVEGQKHAILLSESTFALTLIASKPAGAATVYSDLAARSSSEETTPTAESALEDSAAVLKAIIGNGSGRYPPELRANACSLIGTLLRNLDQDKKAKGELTSLYRDTLKAVREAEDAPEKVVQAARWAQEALAT